MEYHIKSLADLVRNKIKLKCEYFYPAFSKGCKTLYTITEEFTAV